MSSWLESEKKGKCGASCYACPYYRVLCPGCITRICLVDRCIRGTSYTGITYPNTFCRLRAYCVVGKGVRPEPEPPPEVKTKSMARAGLPRFTPIISTLDRRSWFWDAFPLPAICVRLGELMLNKGALRAASEKGLHDFLGYGGKIVLSTVMPDEVIDKLKPEDYLKAIADLRPDVAMIPDNYTYIDDPLYRSWSQTVRLVRYAGAFLDLEIPMLGLIKGAISKQVSWSIEKLAQMGYSSFAMPVRELIAQDLLDGPLTTALYTFKKAGAKPEFIFYGCSHRIWRVKEAGYITLSWYLNAKRGLYDTGVKARSVTYPDLKYVGCECDVCKGARPYDIMYDVHRLSLHNLLQQKARLEGKVT